MPFPFIKNWSPCRSARRSLFSLKLPLGRYLVTAMKDPTLWPFLLEDHLCWPHSMFLLTALVKQRSWENKVWASGSVHFPPPYQEMNHQSHTVSMETTNSKVYRNKWELPGALKMASLIGLGSTNTDLPETLPPAPAPGLTPLLTQSLVRVESWRI